MKKSTLQKQVNKYKLNSDILTKKLDTLNAVISDKDNAIQKRRDAQNEAKGIVKKLQILRLEFEKCHIQLRQVYLRQIKSANADLVIKKNGSYSLATRDILVPKYDILYTIHATHDNGYLQAKRTVKKISFGTQPLEIFVHAKDCKPQGETVKLLNEISKLAIDAYLGNKDAEYCEVLAKTDVNALAFKGLEVATDYDVTLIIENAKLPDAENANADKVSFTVFFAKPKAIGKSDLKVIWSEVQSDGKMLFFCQVSNFDIYTERIKYGGETYDIEMNQHVMNDYYYFIATKQ